MKSRVQNLVVAAAVVALVIGVGAFAADNGARQAEQEAGASAVAGGPGAALGSVQLGDVNVAAGQAAAVSQAATVSPEYWYGGGGCGAETCSECLYLDTYDPSHTTNAPTGSFWVIGPVQTANYLVKGQWYLVTVSGDVSYWGQDATFSPNWTFPASGWSGTPGNPPRYPSPNTVNGYTGFDFEYLFAVPYPHVVDIHLPADDISLDNGATWADYVPVGGQNYNPAHVYKYLVMGQGKQAKFRVTDTGPTADNSGRYKICIQSVCGNDGTSSSTGY
jgi:hypothetical protein